MQILKVGSTDIPITIRHSKKARRLSIRVTPSFVEAIAPEEYPLSKIDIFIKKKREWIYRKVEELNESGIENKFSWPDRFVTGAKIPFHGRNMKLKVATKDISSIEISYSNGFFVEKPINASDTDVKTAMEKWLGFRLKDEVRDLVENYAPTLKVNPGPVTISTLKTLWGSCGKNGNMRINWLLILAPKPVLEYVVVHELCHLRYRNHSTEFWNQVAECLPDFPARKRWLTENGRLMSI